MKLKKLVKTKIMLKCWSSKACEWSKYMHYNEIEEPSYNKNNRRHFIENALIAQWQKVIMCV